MIDIISRLLGKETELPEEKFELSKAYLSYIGNIASGTEQLRAKLGLDAFDYDIVKFENDIHSASEKEVTMLFRKRNEYLSKLKKKMISRRREYLTEIAELQKEAEEFRLKAKEIDSKEGEIDD